MILHFWLLVSDSWHPVGKLRPHYCNLVIFKHGLRLDDPFPRSARRPASRPEECSGRQALVPFVLTSRRLLLYSSESGG